MIATVPGHYGPEKSRILTQVLGIRSWESERLDDYFCSVFSVLDHSTRLSTAAFFDANWSPPDLITAKYCYIMCILQCVTVDHLLCAAVRIAMCYSYSPERVQSGALYRIPVMALPFYKNRYLSLIFGLEKMSES